MMNREIIFKLNDIEKIVLKFKGAFNMQHCCSPSEVFFIKNNHKTSIGKDSIRANLLKLNAMLEKALANVLQLHKSISSELPTKDIGYLENENTHWKYHEHNKNRPANLIYEKGEMRDKWVGEKYFMWGGRLLTWIYNDYNRNIILEITPSYPGHSCIEEDMSKCLPYEEWMKSYKPTLIRTISNDTAQQWLDQTNKSLEIIEKNTQRMLADKTFYTTPHY